MHWGGSVAYLVTVTIRKGLGRCQQDGKPGRIRHRQMLPPADRVHQGAGNDALVHTIMRGPGTAGCSPGVTFTLLRQRHWGTPDLPQARILHASFRDTEIARDPGRGPRDPGCERGQRGPGEWSVAASAWSRSALGTGARVNVREPEVDDAREPSVLVVHVPFGEVPVHH